LNSIFYEIARLPGNKRSHIIRKAVYAIHNHFAKHYGGCVPPLPLITLTGDQHHFTYFPAMHSLMKITAHGCATSNCGLSERIINAGCLQWVHILQSFSPVSVFPKGDIEAQ
jgi:hypothetical protein